MAEGIISTVFTTVFERSVNVTGRQFGYLWNSKKNMDDLEKQVGALESKIIDMDRSVTVAEKNAETIVDETQKWLNEAKDIRGKARALLEEHKENGGKRCLVGLCPNLISRYQFGRRACKKVIDVADVITKKDHIQVVSFRAVNQEKPILSTREFFTFDSRKSILDNILKALQDESKRLVGLYGFGGMGKTTLAKQVASRAEEGKLFEEIVFASVTQKVDMKEIQGQFASMLDLKLEESTAAERANHVRQRLKGKKVLVILDDLWKELDLKEVGVDFGAEHMGCKILLTSRFRHVLNSMGTGEDFNLGALDDEEAWRLFEEKVGGSVLKNSDFHNIGKKVAKKCQGLPVLIVTVAASLSKRPQLRAWNDALNQLENMNHKEMHDIVNSAIESISYNHLEKTHKNLFLLCGVLGGVASIEALLQYSLGWDLFDNPTQTVTIQKARDRLHALILDLKESCLLLDDVDSKKYIKMHDVVRDVAISIGSKDLNMLSIGEYGDELNIWHKDEHLKRCIAMVLRGCPNLPCLPQLLECPSLELFVISGLSRDSSPSVPESFFEKTDKLKVLGISGLNFTALPPSLSFVKNLQTLRVNYCDSLKDISIVGELKKLQILSFAGSDIEELPSGIGQLSDLRSLDVRRCSKLKVIPAGLIEGLTRLEELYVSRYFNRWKEAEECNNGVKINASFQELKHLRKLCSLEITIGDLPEDLYFKKLESYEIIVGVRVYHFRISYIWEWLNKMEVARKFVWVGKLKGINHLQYAVKMLFKSTECLLLWELRGIKNVLPALDGDGFPNLKHLRIQEKDGEIQYVVNVEDTQPMAAFPSMESLHLINLWKLQKISNGPLMEESFCNLTTVKVQDCNELKSLFSFSMATGLSRLQEMAVWDCNALEAIVAEKNVNDDGVHINNGVREEIVEFAQLRNLTLSGLPKLKNFVSNGEIQNKRHKSLQESEIHTEEEDDEEERELKSSLLFFTKVSCPKLEKFELSRISNLTKIWSQRVSENYCNLTELQINECNSLKYMLTPYIAMGLVRLRSLKVRDCAEMKHLVVEEEKGETTIKTIIFPQLSSIRLNNLPNLTTFYSEMGSNENIDTATQPLFNEKVSFPKLEKLELLKIPNLTEIWRHKVSFPKLEELVLYEIPNLTEIWSHKFQEILCCNLRISKCKSMKHVFPSSVAPSLNKLEYLRVEDCEVMKTVIGDENRENEEIIKTTQHEHVAATFVFAKLAEVCLKKLPKVECLYPREHTINCPALMDLEIDDCGKLSVFYFLSFPHKQIEKVISKFETLSIRSIDMMKIRRLYDGHFPTHLFSNLKRLSIVEFHVFPSEFLSIIHNQLTTFRVHNCSFPEIFPHEGEVTSRVNDDIVFPRLDLELKKLPELKYICKHDKEKSFILNILDRLKRILVEECPRLTNLVPHSVSFRSLRYLTVKDCGGLTHLIQPSTATSLQELKALHISGCEMMEKIIGDDNEESSRDDNEIIFPNLETMKLEKLPRLTNFCPSPKYTFNFPQLIGVYVTKFPNMKTFFGGITTTPKLSYVIYEGEWRRVVNTTVQKVFAEMEAKRLSTSLPSTESSIHVDEAKEVIEVGKEGGICVKATAHDKGKGKEVEFSDTTRHSDPSTHNYTAQEQTDAGSVASSSKSGSHSKEFHERLIPSTSSNTQEAEIHDQTAEPTKENQICNHVVDEISEEGTFTENATETRIATEISEDGSEKSAKLEVRELAPLLPSTSSTNYIEAAAQVPESSAKAQNDATNVDKMADTFEKALPSQLHPPISNTLQATSQQKDFQELPVTKHFIPLMSKVLEILQTRPLNRMRPEHIKFMEDASRELSHMNFPMDWLCPYLVKANNCLSVVERANAISKVELKIAEVESQLQALQESKRTLEETKKAMEEENKVIAFSMVLDKPLYEE